MTNSKLTQEPWKQDKNRIWADSGAVCLLYGDKTSEAKANAARIVACVNAMQGIDDPAQFMRDVRDLFKTDNQDLAVHLTDKVEEHLKGGAE